MGLDFKQDLGLPVSPRGWVRKIECYHGRLSRVPVVHGYALTLGPVRQGTIPFAPAIEALAGRK